MKPLSNGWWLCLAAMLGMSCVSCVTSQQSHFSRLNNSYPPKPAAFEVEVFQANTPTRPFENVSRLDVHLEKTFFISSSLAGALPALKEQARLSGAEAIIEIHKSRSMVGETQVYHVTAIGIRYTETK